MWNAVRKQHHLHFSSFSSFYLFIFFLFSFFFHSFISFFNLSSLHSTFFRVIIIATDCTRLRMGTKIYHRSSTDGWETGCPITLHRFLYNVDREWKQWYPSVKIYRRNYAYANEIYAACEYYRLGKNCKISSFA